MTKIKILNKVYDTETQIDEILEKICEITDFNYINYHIEQLTNQIYSLKSEVKLLETKLETQKKKKK